MTSGTHLALTLTLTGGSAADARAVVHTLEPVFGSPDTLPGDDGATVYTATFGSDTSNGGGGDGGGGDGGDKPSAGAKLSTSVTVTLQGSPEAVRQADETLSAAFKVHEEGAASGDQEQERELRLEP
ncbi:hypothetical protein GCM10010372_09410 [Streptomyces tauricus]|uniref:hypothetical protein n=1 Tax=Streptomyces tauricus TaxID=68274 RepID=UPI00167652A5|nr:hypothetical protein [Streptomyces tauricus]GHA11603.1 hypothetical protein GCM10010372_09410 [Streptomyces tauricus]